MSTTAKELEIRATHQRGIGGSMAAGICGVSKWDSPLSIYARIVGEAPPVEENEAMYWGSAIEPLVIARLSAETGMSITPHPPTLETDRFGFPMIAHLDGVAEDGNPIEVKTASAFKKSEWAAEIPLPYYFQVQHYMAATDTARCYVGALIGGQQFVSRTVERSEVVIRRLLAAERDFWLSHVVPRIAPPPDGSRAASEAITALYPRSEPDISVVLPDEAEGLFGAYFAAKAAEDEAAARKTAAEDGIKALLGIAESGVWNEWKATWKSVTSNRIDTKALRAELPEVAARYTKASESRRFTMIEVKS